MDALKRISKLPRLGGRSRRKPEQLVKVEIKVRMDCEGCERKVMKSVEGMKGVTSIEVNREHHKLTVEGYVEPNKVVEQVRKKTGKAAELWQTYADTKVPPPPAYDGDVVAPEKANGLNPDETSSMEEHFTNAFSDENPNTCTLM